MINKHFWPVRPMEPVSVEEPFDSENHLYQIKWDGVRCLAYSGSYTSGPQIYSGSNTQGTEKKIRLINRHLNERTLQYPELVKALSFMPEETVLDGEIVVLGDDGKPSFPRVLQRDLAKTSFTVSKLMKTHPALYMVFDLLWLKGGNMTSLPLVERLDKLAGLLRNKEPVVYVESIFTSGKALAEATRNENIEGIVAKEKNSPYLIATKSPLWKKIKNWRTIDVKVGGCYLDESGKIRSLIIGHQEEDGLRHVGKISSGLTQEHLKILKLYYDTLPKIECPFNKNTGKIKDDNGNILWVPPVIELRVRYLEWGPDGKLRNPSLISFIDFKEE